MSIQEQVTSKELFTSEEWQSLQYSPLWVFSAVAGADGEIDEQETHALVKEVEEAPLYKIPLVRDVFASVSIDFNNIMKQYGADSRDVSEGLGDVADILAKKVSTEESKSFKGALIFLGVNIANASGGFLGFGDHMSDEEKAAIGLIAAVLRADLSDFT
ncbi:hypothetical protein C7B67_23050 [filamentous cyanobacterium Phorm 6]|nr:hypothetical protein C7B67_23050 [filamentous cyanobacterium Phorm 6]